MKKLVSAVISAILFLSVCAVPSFADTNITETEMDETIQPCHTFVTKANSVISIEGTSLLCSSKVSALQSVTKIKAVQTIEKHWALGIFVALDGVRWTKECDEDSMAMENRKPDMPSGTYRLVTDFTVTNSDGRTETVTVYSSEVTIP